MGTFILISVLVILLIAYEAVVKLWLKLYYYEKQGATILPGARIPIIGSVQMYADYGKALKKNKGPLESVYTWDLNKHVGNGSLDFDSTKHKVAIRNLMGYPFLVICDADMASDVFTTQNKNVTKTGHIQQMFEDLGGRPFAFEPSNNFWKERKKLFTTVFLQYDMEKMLDILKQQTKKAVDEWMKKIEINGSTTVDFSTIFERLLLEMYLIVSFGKDLTGELVELEVRKEPGSTECIKKVLTLANALREFDDSVFDYSPFKWLSKWYQMFRAVTGVKNLVSHHETIQRNGKRIRDVLLKHIAARRKTASKEQEASDLLSLFLRQPDVYSDEMILDYITRPLFAAGVTTTQYGLQSMMSHLVVSKPTLQKVREEFESKIQTRSDQAKNLNQLDEIDTTIKERLTMTTTQEEFEYLHHVIMESLRMNPPQPETSWLTFTRDSKVGDMHFKKGDIFSVNFSALGYDKVQWQRPHEFIPERFDNKNPISLKPDGTRRSPHAWVPFSGGHRVCFGRKLGEATSMTICSYLTQTFDFEFVDPKFKSELPVAVNSMSNRNKIEVVLTKRLRP